jgi:hypothetical protein
MDMLTQYETITVGTFVFCVVLAFLYAMYYFNGQDKKG